ncbi:hypothetical protein BDP27DRAFT_139326 [Rhodocollybia butyracea]|uniref:Uncharacterized protein n=1 Tax=Rhodocollybia butyracea TaxID=206335 RepID=A0A9P5Q4Q7_9AGAR|nr:hypothetical protein BDP27DRAFT_139326 [Rhodocollybia butyracea]
MSATSTSPSSSSTSGGRNSGPSLIGPNTTQSQILLFVFLAVGLFSAVAIATLGWRRAYHVRTQWDARRVGRTEGVKSCRGDLRPRLWDLWTKLTEGVEAGVKVAESEALVSNEENVGPRIKTGRWEDFMVRRLH